MDKVGNHGRGESVWLAFFLYDILNKFTEVALYKNDTSFAAKCMEEAKKLKQNINENAWDGEWFRRGYLMMERRWDLLSMMNVKLILSLKAGR